MLAGSPLRLEGEQPHRPYEVFDQGVQSCIGNTNDPHCAGAMTLVLVGCLVLSLGNRATGVVEPTLRLSATHYRSAELTPKPTTQYPLPSTHYPPPYSGC